jgi:hypothetical protein
MARMIPSAERIKKARVLIQKARELEVPADGGHYNMAYIGEVKTLLRQARDLIKFISYTPTATEEMKQEVAQIFEECAQTDQELLRGKKD